MPKFVCEKCQYKLEKSVAPARCPYCGKEDSMVAEKSAQDILDEVSRDPKSFD